MDHLRALAGAGLLSLLSHAALADGVPLSSTESANLAPFLSRSAGQTSISVTQVFCLELGPSQTIKSGLSEEDTLRCNWNDRNGTKVDTPRGSQNSVLMKLLQNPQYGAQVPGSLGVVAYRASWIQCDNVTTSPSCRISVRTKRSARPTDR